MLLFGICGYRSAKKYWKKAKVYNKIKSIIGDGQIILDQLLSKKIFFDIVEVISEHYMPACMPRAIFHSPKNKKYSENELNFDKLFFKISYFVPFVRKS